MAATCDLITAPTGGAPLSTADYDAQNNYITAAINRLLADQLHLTEWDTLTVPDISNSVYVEHGGALFQVTGGDLAITGAPNNGRVYVKVVRTANALDFSFVNSAAGYTWNYVYNGFYSGSDQLLPYVLYKDGTDYYKFDLNHSLDKYDISAYIEFCETTTITWNMDTITGKNISGIINYPTTLIVNMHVSILNNAGTSLLALNKYDTIGGDVQPAGYWTRSVASRTALSFFDAAAYNAATAYVTCFYRI